MINAIHKHDGLPGSLAKKESPKEIISICSCCQKIHVDKKSWQQRDLRLSEKANTLFSHGLCPDCYEEQRIEFLKFRARPTFEQPKDVKTSPIIWT